MRSWGSQGTIINILNVTTNVLFHALESRWTELAKKQNFFLDVQLYKIQIYMLCSFHRGVNRKYFIHKRLHEKQIAKDNLCAWGLLWGIWWKKAVCNGPSFHGNQFNNLSLKLLMAHTASKFQYTVPTFRKVTQKKNRRVSILLWSVDESLMQQKI